MAKCYAVLRATNTRCYLFFLRAAQAVSALSLHARNYLAH
ncbi:hypothetical protein ALP26_101820 [Pseudomonas savastanoi pv. glycinea]|uniref:Uncharacterized protein n=8 Tax=Pseudomonas syringae group TaxID=136849 RepID=A0A0P9WFF7_PSESG|nr:Unknown protein sequence [Pseudomonas savastanoi pv. phaseolicola]KPB62941.1 Unknown protein sequence [Pseudomonas amygdali pv. mellea]KPB83218.1 Unknown protein sequence [Pseudomonas syringae pv. maculicola]KPC22569.1 Unknown protein sequence [Pseudomonas savastanoi pv. glycinea]KPX25233.1 hypothetical protein ALO71_101335 [Pseudomonas amygdali pv. dendropanacis]KPX54496.1 hypothetical protein ALO67_101053 [Pseudomonas amygdali pv. hibisci]KPX85576.1 hypothetical protein ALO64_100239 [Pse